MTKTYYTYAHIRNDKNTIFYIGKGKNYRAWSHAERNNYWHNIVNKHGYTIQILSNWEDEQDAFSHEKLLILCFRAMNYELVNFTDGGDGVSGMKHSQESREKMSNTSKEKWKDKEFSKKMTEIRRNQWTNEARKNASVSSEKIWRDEDVKKKHSEKLKTAYASEKMKKIQADRNRKFRESPEGKKEFIQRIKNYWDSPKSQTEEQKMKRKEAIKKGWETRRNKKNEIK